MRKHQLLLHVTSCRAAFVKWRGNHSDSVRCLWSHSFTASYRYEYVSPWLDWTKGRTDKFINFI